MLDSLSTSGSLRKEDPDAFETTSFQVEEEELEAMSWYWGWEIVGWVG